MADRYWVGGAGTWDTTSTTHWSTSPGGSSGASVPSINDSVFFDQAGTYTVTMTGALNCVSFNVSAGTVTFATGTAPTLTVAGSMTLLAGTVWTSTGAISFTSSVAGQTIITNGTTINAPITFNGLGEWTLGSALTTGLTLTTTLLSGTLILNGFDLTTGIFSSNGSSDRFIAFGSNNIILAHTTAAQTVLEMSNTTGFDYSGTGGFVSGMSVTRTFSCGTTAAISGSISLNGTSSMLEYPAGTTPLVFGTGDFTIEAWINLTDLNAIQCIWSMGAGTTTSSTLFFGTSGTGLYLEIGANIVQVRADAAGLVANTWIHVAVVRISGFVNIYVNGVSKGSGTLSNNYAANGVGRIGSGRGGASSWLGGKISNFRIVKGIGVYTGPFTPSSSPLTATQPAGTNISAITGTQTSLLLNTPNNSRYLYDNSSHHYTATNTSVTANALTPITVLPAAGTPPNLSITSGASIPTISTGSYFQNLDFTGSTCTPATTTVNLNGDLTFASGGTYTSVTAVLNGFSTLTPNGKTMAALTFQGSQTVNGTLGCTIFTINSTSFDFNSGTITPSTSVVITGGGALIYSGSATLGSVATFTHTLGSATFNKAYALTATGTYTFTAGYIILGATLSTGIFSSSNTNTRNINFSTNNIILTHTTALTTVLSMAIATGFTCTTSGGFASGTGCFQATMSVTRTFTFGTTGGSATNAPKLFLDSGASVPTITTGSWFNELNLGGTSFTIAATNLNLNNLVSNSSTSVLTNLTATMRGTGFLATSNTIGPLVINSTNGTTYISAGQGIVCTTCTLTSGSLNMYSGGILTCSSTFTFAGGSLDYIGTINCTTFTVSGGTFTFYNGTITPSVSFTVTGGTFTYGAGSGTIPALPTFTHTAGTVNFLQNYALTTTGTYTFTAGTLNIYPSVILSTGIFSSSNANTRTIGFGTPSSAGYINLTHTTAATVVLNMATLTGFSQTGLGGFQVADMANTRTFSVGNTAGGSAATAPSLFFTTGASVATLTTAGWFKDLYFGDTTFNPGTTSLNVAGNLTMGNGTYTTVTIAMRGSGYLWNRYNSVAQTIGPLSINTTGTIDVYPGYTFNCTTLAITAGTLDFTGIGGTITCSSTVTYTGGTLNLTDGAIYCTTFTLNGPSWTFNAGTLIPSVSFVLTTGSFTYGGTANLNENVLPLFTHTAGTVTLNKTLQIGQAGTSGTYTFTAGTLTLTEGSILTCAIFSSSNANTRTINFGTTKYTPAYYNYPNGGTNTIPPSYIQLYNTTAAQTVLNMAIATGFTYTGSGVFYFAGANTGTMVFGTTGGSTTTAPNLFAGNNALTVTSGSWFNVFNIINNANTTTAALVNVVEAFIMYPQGTHTGVTISPQLSTTSIINEGQTFGGLTLNVAGINVQLSEPLYLAGALTLTQGTLTMGTFDVTSATFASTGTATRAIIGSTINTYNITGSGATAFSNASGTGLTMAGFTINMNSATAKTFAGGGGSFPTLNQGGAGALTITGTNTFYNITNTVQPATINFTAATTTTFKYFSLDGTAGNLVTITSATAANHTLSMSSGVANTQYMSISRSTATGGAGWIADLSTNGANNAGWVFAAPRFVDMGDISFNTAGGGITFTP